MRVLFVAAVVGVGDAVEFDGDGVAGGDGVAAEQAAGGDQAGLRLQLPTDVVGAAESSKTEELTTVDRLVPEGT